MGEMMGKKIEGLTPLSVLLSLAIVLLLISAAVTLTLQSRWLYYMDMEILDIPTQSGYSQEIIRENYDALIKYNSVFYSGELIFPSLPMSETGKIHFEEVKKIFSSIQIMGLILVIPVIIASIWRIKKRQYYFLKLSAILSIALPALIGLLMAINWNGFFIIFHKLFFRNDYWVFDYNTDPVIRILPNQFFLHSAVMILIIMVLLVAAILGTYLILEKRKHREP